MTDNERTLSLIKPDATRRHLTGLITTQLEKKGLFIIAQKRLYLTEEQAAAFYAVHSERSFFGELCRSMSTGPIVAQVLEAPNAIASYRKLMGETNPAAAEEGTLRHEFGLSIEENSVHGSDSMETAQSEIPFFFSHLEIIG